MTLKRPDALLHFQQATKLKPDYWDAHFNLGMSYRQQGRLGEAQNEFETVLRLHPDFPLAKALAEIQAQELHNTAQTPGR